MTAPEITVDIVIPSAGRPTLERLLDALACQTAALPGRVIVVDDRREPGATRLPGCEIHSPTVLHGGGRGPAAARNSGWRASSADWIAFLDDDVIPGRRWIATLLADLDDAGTEVGGVQGRVLVPLMAGRRPTDAERGAAGLQSALWATADMAYRRSALVACGGFDERFPRAYREDAELALRVRQAGYRLRVGRRRVAHPPHAETTWSSIRRQRGNRDDALMRAVHGADWRRRAAVPRGALRRHAALVGLGAAGLLLAPLGRRRAADAALAAALAGISRFAAERMAAGPPDASELAALAGTSMVIPPLAVGHRLAGEIAVRRARPLATPRRPAMRAVLFDRDGTLIEDVPENGDAERVRPLPGAPEALARLRSAGLRLAVVTNQGAIGRGRVSAEAVETVNRRVAELLGPFDEVLVCPHAPQDGCGCRKPRPGMVEEAARRLGVPPAACAVVGDTGADVEAARAAGAMAVLVPNRVTRAEEVAAAPAVAPDVEAAVDLLLEGRP